MFTTKVHQADDSLGVHFMNENAAFGLVYFAVRLR